VAACTDDVDTPVSSDNRLKHLRAHASNLVPISPNVSSEKISCMLSLLFKQ
jgi:hypothetical protein